MDRKTQNPDARCHVSFGGLGETEFINRLEEGLRRMPGRRRAIFLAVRLDGATYAEVAARTGLSVRQVERELASALLELDGALQGKGCRPWWRRLFAD